MQKALLLACVAATPSLIAVPAAHAHPTYHYRGGCGMAVVSDGTDDVNTRWDGFIWGMAAATDATTGAPAAVSIMVECELRLNGAFPGTVVFSASGTGSTVGVGQLSFHADPDDVVSLCDSVSVDGNYHKDCEDVPTSSVLWEPLAELAEIFTDSTCDEVAALDGGPLDQPPAFDIRPDGNVYAIDDGVHVWHCPTQDNPRRRYYVRIDPEPPLPDVL